MTPRIIYDTSHLQDLVSFHLVNLNTNPIPLPLRSGHRALSHLPQRSKTKTLKSVKSKIGNLLLKHTTHKTQRYIIIITHHL